MSTDRAYIIKAITGHKTRVHPGFPLTNFPVSVTSTLNEMIASGELVVTSITKNHPAFGIVTRHYVKIA